VGQERGRIDLDPGRGERVWGGDRGAGQARREQERASSHRVIPFLARVVPHPRIQRRRGVGDRPTMLGGRETERFGGEAEDGREAAQHRDVAQPAAAVLEPGGEAMNWPVRRWLGCRG
jgi:hypothetical protein